MRTRRHVLKFFITFAGIGRAASWSLPVQTFHAAYSGVAFAQGNGNGNGGGNGGNGNGGGGGSGNGGDNGNGNSGGTGNGGGSSNSGSGGGNGRGESNKSGDGRASDADSPANSSSSLREGQQSGRALEVRHANGITETLRGGRYSMRDNKGRVIVDRPATAKDRSRFRPARSN